ncbi:regulatory protein RecX [Cryocola sp. 340MFSha3.1]|uniref:regulatory protein RecX n=1 Tax=Cryocola sp. 340MFSha3.1 TaxID=1169145 RepID=UPI0003A91D04|nr:regulatory protein RecX [Cryocola sp. 340MFSha3.1]
MVVKFPSSPQDDQGDGTSTAEAGAREHLAPVTPLRRAASARGADGDQHPSRRGKAREGRSQEGVVRPVVALPGEAPGGDAAAGAARGRPGQRTDAGSDSGWNNTWGAEPPAPSIPDEAEVDEETVRQARKTSGVAIRQLARRGMSRWELEQLLTKREIDPAVYGPELDRLEVLGVIDDAALAATLAFTQHSRKGLGRTAIEQELKRRHIDPVLIEAALADIGDDDELERATELAVKRMGQLSSYDDETARRRLHGFLARKGYASDVVRQAMDAAFATRRPRGGSGVRFQ